MNDTQTGTREDRAKAARNVCGEETGERIQEAQLNIGDRIRIGEMVLICERAAVKGTETVIRELKNEMDSGGKGFKTMLIEIVGNGKKNNKSSTDKINP